MRDRHCSRRQSAPGRLRQAGPWLLSCGLVALGHLALLAAFVRPAAEAPSTAPAPGATALQLLPAAALPPPGPAAPGAAPAPAPLRTAAPASAPLRTAAPGPQRPAPSGVAEPAPADLPPATTEDRLASSAASADHADTAEVPVYPTLLPEPTRLHYRMQRGERAGSAWLQWQFDASGYLLRLDAHWPEQPAQGSSSRGLIDAEGVAPVRHAELRRARELRAVNFQREAGRITFSGPQASYRLRAGAQDRLSWMIQLPAILQADASLTRPGAQLRLFVAGTRGDGEAWQFEVLGREALQLPVGDVPEALLLRREPGRPYDTRVELWLDPTRQYLPVRVRFTTLPGGAPLELTLAGQEAAPAPLESGGDVPR
jgi:hypothetical protein